MSDARLDPGAPLLRLARLVYVDWFGYVEGQELQHALSGSLLEFFKSSLPGPFYRFADLLSTSRLPKVFGMFLVGLWLGRSQILQNAEAHRHLLRRVLALGLAVGLPAIIVLAHLLTLDAPAFTPAGLLETTAYAAGVAPLALAYAAGFVLLWQRARGAVARDLRPRRAYGEKLLPQR